MKRVKTFPLRRTADLEDALRHKTSLCEALARKIERLERIEGAHLHPIAIDLASVVQKFIDFRLRDTKTALDDLAGHVATLDGRVSTLNDMVKTKRRRKPAPKRKSRRIHSVGARRARR